MSFSRLLLALLLVMLVPATRAHAQPTDKAHAESLFRQGRQKIREGEAEQACKLFEQSQQLEPSIGTLLNLALCYEKLGKTASAWAAFVEVSEEAERLKHADRAAFAKEHAEQLEPELARLRLSLKTAAPDMTATMDDKRLAIPADGSALPFDPGPHELAVSAPGKKSWTKTVTAQPGQTLDVVVAELVDEPTAPAPSSVAQTQPSESDAGISLLAPIGFGVGGAALIVGVVTGISSLEKSDELLESCNEASCPEAQRGAYKEADRLANASNIAFAIAGVGVALGIIGVVLSELGSEEVDSALVLDGAAIGIRF